MSFRGNYVADSFKLQLLQGGHNFLTNTIKLALYDNTPTFNNTTTQYTASGEVVAGGSYVAGGGTLVASTAVSNSVAYVTFNNITFTGVAFPYAYGALIYNATNLNAAIAVLDFGGARIPAPDGSFTVTFPIAAYDTALIRIS